MNKVRIIGVVGILCALIVVLFAMGRKEAEAPSKAGVMNVTASFYPLAFLAEQVGGDMVHVTNITPAGAEPHEYEPTPHDMAAIEDSRVLILNGLGLEPWGKNVVKNIDSKKTIVLSAGDDLDVMHAGDPHIWLSPSLMQNLAERIEASFREADPKNEAIYLKNLLALKDRIRALDDEYRTGLANCRLRSIVTSHEAFGYLAGDYGLTEIPIAGLSPDTEPSPTQLAEITRSVKENGSGYIFFESLSSPKLAETLARETGTKTMVLNPLEGLTPEEIAAKKDYLTEMRSNLANLQIALQCQK